MTPPSASERLAAAEAHLAEAHARFDDGHPSVVLDGALASARETLLAFLAAYGTTADAEAPLPELAAHTDRLWSATATPARRLARLDARAGAVRSAARPGVHEREDAETAWYAARNLLGVVRPFVASSARA